MGTDGDVVPRKKLDHLDLRGPAFELDDLGTPLLHQSNRIGEREFARRIAREWQIRHQQRAVQAARYGLTVIDHLVHGDRHRSVVALDDHTERIADQHDVRVRFVDKRCEARVIAGQRGDLLALGLHLVQRGERYRRSRRITQLQMGIHGNSPDKFAKSPRAAAD